MFFYNRKARKFEFYPKAFVREKRRHGHDPEIVPTRKRFIKLAATNLFILEVLFLLLFAYLYGALYHSSIKVDNLRVLFVDYDSGIIGQAVRHAYTGLRGPGFPTLVEQTPQQFESPQALSDTVCQAQYWAALFVQQGASTTYTKALGGGTAASSYNESFAMTYIWNQARYGSLMDGLIVSNLAQLSNSAKGALLPIYASSTATININTADPNVLAIISQP